MSKNDLGSCAGADQVYLHKDGFSTSRSEIKQLEARNASNQSIAHLQFVFTHFEQFNVSVGPLNLSPQVPISHRPRFGWCWVLLLWGRWSCPPRCRGEAELFLASLFDVSKNSNLNQQVGENTKDCMMCVNSSCSNFWRLNDNHIYIYILYKCQKVNTNKSCTPTSQSPPWLHQTEASDHVARL